MWWVGLGTAGSGRVCVSERSPTTLPVTLTTDDEGNRRHCDRPVTPRAPHHEPVIHGGNAGFVGHQVQELADLRVVAHRTTSGL